MIETPCNVEREGAGRAEVPLDEIVVGDVVPLCSGDIVPADLRIHYAHAFDQLMSTSSAAQARGLELLADPRPEAKAQLHWRIPPPLLALAFALLALPLARSTPRQQRYGSIMLAFLAYMVGVQLSILGRQWLAKGDIPAGLGMWWLTVPLLALAAWMYFRDGRLSRRKRGRA